LRFEIGVIRKERAMAGIVVGVDGSENAELALEWAVTEAELRNVPVTAVTVVPIPPVTLAPSGVAVMGEMLQAAEAATRAAVEKVSMGHQAVVSVQAIVGGPAEQLLNAATGADMLVVGSRGRGGFARLLLGSVSSQVVHHAVCPTVVVPARRRT
jgi:nucleotide-binding universal stress UspA family protein